MLIQLRLEYLVSLEFQLIQIYLECLEILVFLVCLECLDFQLIQIYLVALGQAAVEKIKEKLLDKNSIASQKKSNRLKKINGWDIAQMVTSGIRKLTGRKLEVKPYYNNEGDVTAYAVSAGRFQISSGNNH